MARNGSFLALPAMPLFCMCSMLVPSEFSLICENSPRKNCVLHFPWKSQHFREREKVAETFRQCTFSFDNLLFFLILVRVIAQEASKTLKCPSGCAHLLVHIRRPPILWVRRVSPGSCQGSPGNFRGSLGNSWRNKPIKRKGGMSAERNCPRKTFKSIRKTV